MYTSTCFHDESNSLCFLLKRNGAALTSETFVTWSQIPTGSLGPTSVVLVASVTPVYLGHPMAVTRMTTP